MDLSRLLRPRSIAVFGGAVAEAVIGQCDRMGYDGAIWPIHPRRTDIRGRRCARTLAELPERPDAAFIGVNRRQTIDIVRELARAGAGGAVAYASGFAEAGEEGARLQDNLRAAAAAMPVLGPNCYGLINYLDGALLWPDIHGGRRVERGVAIIGQSSNVAVNLTMNRRGLPVAYLATLGNQATIGLSAMMDALLDDARVSAMGLHIEGIDDVAAFAEAAAKARARGIPLVALKAGRSKGGTRLALSHTASLTGTDEVMDALLARLGIARVA